MKNKKSIVLIILTILPFVALSANDFNLGNMGEGYFLDAQNSAIWEIKPDGIRILDADTKDEQWDFRNSVLADFESTVNPDMANIVTSFTVEDWGRHYTFTKDTTSLNIEVEIATSGYNTDNLTLVFQEPSVPAAAEVLENSFDTLGEHTDPLYTPIEEEHTDPLDTDVEGEHADSLDTDM